MASGSPETSIWTAPQKHSPLYVAIAATSFNPARRDRVRVRSCLDDHRLEIRARDDQRAVLRHVEFVEQRVEIDFERLASFGIDRFERLENWAVIGAEKLDPVLGRLVAEGKVFALRRDSSSVPT